MLPPEAPPKNLCIVRLSALGDVTHVVPVLRAIQRHWPETKITWVCATVEHQLLSMLDGVRFAVINKKAGWRGYRDLRRQLAFLLMTAAGPAIAESKRLRHVRARQTGHSVRHR